MSCVIDILVSPTSYPDVGRKIFQRLIYSGNQTIYTLTDGLSEDIIAVLENEVNQQLPLDMRCAYRIHNGQRVNDLYPG